MQHRNVHLARATSAGLILSISTGCVVATENAGATVWRYHWSVSVFPILLGAAILSCGILILLGRWKTSRGPRVGAVLAVLGVCLAAAVILIVPFSQVTLTADRLLVEEGFLGWRALKSVDLRDVSAIDLYDIRRRSQKKKTWRTRTVASFLASDGTKETIGIKGPLIQPAITRILVDAEHAGTPITDRRNTKP